MKENAKFSLLKYILNSLQRVIFLVLSYNAIQTLKKSRKSKKRKKLKKEKEKDLYYDKLKE